MRIRNYFRILSVILSFMFVVSSGSIKAFASESYLPDFDKMNMENVEVYELGDGVVVVVSDIPARTPRLNVTSTVWLSGSFAEIARDNNLFSANVTIDYVNGPGTAVIDIARQMAGGYSTGVGNARVDVGRRVSIYVPWNSGTYVVSAFSANSSVTGWARFNIFD